MQKTDCTKISTVHFYITIYGSFINGISQISYNYVFCI